MARPRLWAAGRESFCPRGFTNDEKQDGSWTVPEHKTIAFRYRVVLYDGEYTLAQLAEMYSQYAAMNESR